MTDWKGATFTLTNNVETRPAPSIDTGPIEVSGTITARFEGPGFTDWVSRCRNASRNQLLRQIRPHMPKRMFQRLRGRMRARDRGLSL